MFYVTDKISGYYDEENGFTTRAEAEEVAAKWNQEESTEDFWIVTEA